MLSAEEWLARTDQDRWTFTFDLGDCSLGAGEAVTALAATITAESLAVPESVKKCFNEHGFAVFPSVLSRYDVDRLNDRLEEVLRGNYDGNKPPDKAPRLLKNSYNCNARRGDVDVSSPAETQPGLTEKQASLGSNGNSSRKIKKKPAPAVAKGPLGFSGNLQNVKVLQVINVHKADTLFRRLACSPALGKVVAELAGWDRRVDTGGDDGAKPGTRLAQDQVWAKPPGGPPLVYHRDSPYFMFEPDRVVTAWIALDDMDAELGPLEYAVGSHRWGDGRVGSSNQFFNSSGGKSLLLSAAEREGVKECDIELVSMAGLPAGSVTVHDGTRLGIGMVETHPGEILTLFFLILTSGT